MVTEPVDDDGGTEDLAFRSAVGERLARARREAGFATQEDARVALGLGNGNLVSLWETGKKLPGSLNLLRLCRTYKRSADWVLGISDRPNFKCTGGVIDLEVERAIHAAKSWKELEQAARRLEVYRDGVTILHGYEIPTEFEALDDTEFEMRRASIEQKAKRLWHERGKAQRTPPRRD